MQQDLRDLMSRWEVKRAAGYSQDFQTFMDFEEYRARVTKLQKQDVLSESSERRCLVCDFSWEIPCHSHLGTPPHSYINVKRFTSCRLFDTNQVAQALSLQRAPLRNREESVSGLPSPATPRPDRTSPSPPPAQFSLSGWVSISVVWAGHPRRDSSRVRIYPGRGPVDRHFRPPPHLH